MDYQNAIVDMLGDPDELLSHAEEAIALVRDRGAHVGCDRGVDIFLLSEM
jgi:hypothetical protein